MSEKRCPLCGEPVSGDECFSCGYIFPDFEKISAPYDLDPSNDLFGAAAEEAPVSLGMDSVEDIGIPPLKAAPRLEDINEEPKAGGAVFKSAQANPLPNIQARMNPAPPAVRNNPMPPQGQQQYGQNNPPPQLYNPVQGNLSPSNMGTSFVKAVVDFTTKHWWQFLLAFILPSAGFILGFFYLGIGKLDKKFERSLLGIVFMVLSTMLMANGIDIFGMNEYIIDMFF